MNELEDYPKECKTCGKKIIKFRSFKDGYKFNWCSVSCQKSGTNKIKRDNNEFKYQKPIKKLSIQQINEKRKNTMLERYGVTSYNSKFFVEKRIKNRMLGILKNKLIYLEEEKITPLFNIDEYTGSKVDYKWLCKKCNNEFLDSLANGTLPLCPVCNTPNASKPQHEIKAFLDTLNLSPRLNDRSILKRKEIDIFIPSKNLGIEFHGLYWHSEKANVFDKNHMVDKIELLKKHNIKLVQIMEDEWMYKQDIVKSRLSSLCGHVNRVFARKLQLDTEISYKEAESFLLSNHIQGNCKSNVRIGLRNNDELLCLMTFGKPRFNKKYEWELLRYCTKLNNLIVGGPSRLLNAFILNYNPKSIISYADRRWSDGNMYKKIGFNMEEVISPNYSYVTNKGIRLNRMNFQKHKLKKILKNFSPDLTEVENCANNNLYRIWDAGSYKFVYFK